VNCSNNKSGPNCEKCADNFFLDTNECKLCDCDDIGSNSKECDQTTGQCSCKQNVYGRRCDECKMGYYNLSKGNLKGCLECKCNSNTTISIPNTNLFSCDPLTGQCECKSRNVKGLQCNECADSMYNFQSNCNLSCDCNPLGSVSSKCNQLNGSCDCKLNVEGRQCNQCSAGFYNLTSFGCLSQCFCDAKGSINVTYCEQLSGDCQCKQGYGGKSCDKCSNGYWTSPNGTCIQCVCNKNGVLDPNNICDETTGKCICNSVSIGTQCDKCQQGYWGLTETTSCKVCECDSLGTDKSTLVVSNGLFNCNAQTGQCLCNKNRIGQNCQICDEGYFFLNFNGIDCFPCSCDPAGSIPGSICDNLTGECVCKVANGISGTRCDQCAPSFYNFKSSTGS
jgi:hypothetical protein